MIAVMSKSSFRVVPVLLGAAVALQTPLAAAQTGEPNTWTDSPAEPQPQPGAQETAPQQTDEPATGEFQDTDPRAITDFRPALDPYGQWVDDPTYGTVWVPSYEVVGSNFAPYVTSGHWALTSNNDWIWVSDYPFGWVTFHYGRWVWITGTGWAWIPGRKYANAWVEWRVPRDEYAYIGWAPMPPSYVWFGGLAVGVGFGVYTPWVFCPSYYAFYPGVHRYIVRNPYYVHSIATHTVRYAPPAGRMYGPPPVRARIPANAVPSQRVAANPQAVAAARRETAYRAFSATPAPRSAYSYSAMGGRAGPTRLSSPRTLGTSAPRPMNSVGPQPMTRSVYPSGPRPVQSFTSGPRPVQSFGSRPVGSYSGPAAYSARPMTAPVRSFSSGPTRMGSYAPYHSFSSAPIHSFSSAPTRGFAPAPMHSFSSPSFGGSSFGHSGGFGHSNSGFSHSSGGFGHSGGGFGHMGGVSHGGGHGHR